jgi:hypothetical protein
MFGRRYRDASEMIRSRWITDPWLAVTIRPPFRSRANATIARSISPGSRTSIGVNPTPNDAGAIAWITANWPIPAASAGSRRTAARVKLGAISLSSSSHFPLRLYSNARNPVMLPPGRARLATNPAPTGSMTSMVASAISISQDIFGLRRT